MAGVSSRPDHHAPVLCGEVLDALNLRADALYVDGTFGRGGHSKAMLAAARCRVVAIDRDPATARAARVMAADHGERFTFITGRFGAMDRLLAEAGATPVDGGVLLDCGVSSPQLDDPARGFSLKHDGALDMRMGADGATAADLVNSADEATLARWIGTLGEERRARAVARAIVAARAKSPITRTGQLADIIRAVVPAARDGLDPATRSFQAIRIQTNDELGELERGLDAAERVMVEGARLAVIAFHSLEDRQVKHFMRTRSGKAPQRSRHQPPGADGQEPSFREITRRPIRPDAAEIARNPRARSARLRVAERTAAPPWRDPGLSAEQPSCG